VKIESDLFDIQANSDFTFYVNELAESEEHRALYFTRNNYFHYSQSKVMLGVVECIGGSIEKGIFDRIYNAKRLEAEELAGYIEEPEDESPLEFSTTFNSELGLKVHHHMVRETGLGYVLVITLLEGFLDPDFLDVRKLLAEIECKTLTYSVEDGELIQLRLLSETQQSRFGNRMILNPLEIV
jgi:hypothetical protein